MRTYKFEILSNAIEEHGLPEAMLFRGIFGAVDENAAVEFVNQIFQLWKERNLLNSPIELTFKINLESFVPDAN
jgi:hypothetical protein